MGHIKHLTSVSVHEVELINDISPTQTADFLPLKLMAFIFAFLKHSAI